MGTQLGEAFVPIRATLDKLDGDLAAARGKVEGAMGKIGQAGKIAFDNIQKAGTIALVGIGALIGAVGVLGGLLATTIGPARDLNETMSKVGVVFGDSAGTVLAFGDTAAKALGMSKDAALTAAGTYGNLFRSMGMTEGASADMSVSLVQLAGDLSSFNNIPTAEVLEKLRAGLTGETEPLKVLGINISAAAIDAEAMALGLKKVNGELPPAAKAQATYSLILKQTTLAQGDFARTSEGLANQQRIAAAQVENLKAKIGTSLLPVVALAAQVFNNFLSSPTFQAGIDAVTAGISSVVDAVGAFLNNLSMGTDPIEAFGYSLYSLFGFDIGNQFIEIANSVKAFIEQVIAVVTPIWEAITGFVSWQDVLIALGIAIAAVIIPIIISFISSILPIVAAVVGLIAVIALLRNAWENDWGGIRTALTDFWNNTGKPALEALWEWLSINIPIAIQVLSDFWTNVLQPAIAAVWNWLSTVLIPFIKDVLYDWIYEKLPSALKTLSDFWTNTLKPAIMDVWNWLNTVLIPFIRDTLVPWLETNIPLAIQTLQGWWDNLVKTVTTVYDYISGTFIPTLTNLGDLIGTVLAGIVGTFIELLTGKTSLKDAFTKVYNYVKDFFSPIIGGLVDLFEKTVPGPIKTFITDVLGKLKKAFDGIKDAIQFVIDKIVALIDWFKKVEAALPPWMKPGSPTPWEIGLRGVVKQFKELDTLTGSMPLFNGLGAVMPAMAAAGSEAPQDTGMGSSSYTANTTIYTNRDPLRVLHASRHLDKLGRLR